MAYTYKLKLLDYDPHFVLSIPAASAAVIEPGMLVKYASNEVTQISGVADHATVIGLANGRSLAGETADIPVITKFTARATVTSATYEFGAGLKMEDAFTGALVADANADTIAWAWEYGATVTSLVIYFDITQLSGKLWDVCSA